MTLPALYDQWAELWPYLQGPEDVAEETAAIEALLVEQLGLPELGRPDGAHINGADKPTLVEFGAGGGATLAGLARRFDCTAVDLSPAMLEHVAALDLPIHTVCADMRTARLGKTFDALLCADAIDHLSTREDAQAALQTLAAHLRPGGVAIVAPTYTDETFVDGDWSAFRRPDDDPAHDAIVRTLSPDLDAGPELTVMSVAHRLAPDAEAFELTVAIVRRDAPGGVAHLIEDRQRCGLFAESFWLESLGGAGFEARAWAQAPGGARWFVGRRC
ncbi:MAG: class I SAM-dependent methyltransferase [Planctomycetota bacterium]